MGSDCPAGFSEDADPGNGLVFSGISKYYGLDQHAEFVDLSVLEDQVVAGLANPKWAPEVKQLLSVVSEVAPLFRPRT